MTVAGIAGENDMTGQWDLRDAASVVVLDAVARTLFLSALVMGKALVELLEL